MIKAICFDFDGVICDTEPATFNYKLRKMAEMGFPVSKEFLLARVGLSFREMFKREFSVENPQQYIDEYYNGNEKRNIDYKSIMYPEVPLLLEYCKQNNIRCVVTSNSNHERLVRAIQDLELSDYFENIYSNEHMKISKPDPLFYTTVVEDLKLNKDEVMVIEDSYTGIQASHNANLFTVAIKENFFNIDQSNADVIVEKHSQIIEILKKCR